MATPTLHKYCKIVNTYVRKAVDAVQDLEYKGDWVVTEKIHGANFSFTVFPDGTIKPASRNNFLATAAAQSSFYQSDVLVGRYESAVGALLRFVRDQDPTVEFVQVIGELFGGEYPGHPKVAKRVQKGVFYCPTIEFLAFDIYVRRADEEDGRYLGWDDFQRACVTTGIPVVPFVFRGSFRECLQYSGTANAESTSVPACLGLPDLGPTNVREGHVIKPAQDVRQGRFRERVIFKDKNRKFKEKAIANTKGKPQEALSDEWKVRTEEALLYVTANRLSNVESKTGPDVHPMKLASLLVQDVWADMKNDDLPWLKDMDNRVRRAIQKSLMAASTDLVLNGEAPPASSDSATLAPQANVRHTDPATQQGGSTSN